MSKEIGAKVMLYTHIFLKAHLLEESLQIPEAPSTSGNQEIKLFYLLVLDLPINGRSALAWLHCKRWRLNKGSRRQEGRALFCESPVPPGSRPNQIPECLQFQQFTLHGFIFCGGTLKLKHHALIFG